MATIDTSRGSSERWSCSNRSQGLRNDSISCVTKHWRKCHLQNSVTDKGDKKLCAYILFSSLFSLCSKTHDETHNLQFFNLFTLRINQRGVSPYNIISSLSRKMMKRSKNISLGLWLIWLHIVRVKLWEMKGRWCGEWTVKAWV